MKTHAIIFSILTLVTFNSYSQKVDVKGLLDKPETRNEVFNAISGNHELMVDFMKSIKGNEHAMMMLKENNQMEGQDGNRGMKNEHQMMGMMKNNPEMMQKMMANMMEMCKQDTSMLNKITNILVKQPEMMQVYMQGMKENGMMGEDGKLKLMNTESQSMHQEHNHLH